MNSISIPLSNGVCYVDRLGAFVVFGVGVFIVWAVSVFVGSLGHTKACLRGFLALICVWVSLLVFIPSLGGVSLMFLFEFFPFLLSFTFLRHWRYRWCVPGGEFYVGSLGIFLRSCGVLSLHVCWDFSLRALRCSYWGFVGAPFSFRSCWHFYGTYLAWTWPFSPQ